MLDEQLADLFEEIPEPPEPRASAVVVPDVPFPPVSAYGLPEFQSLADMPRAGITFRNLFFVDQSQAFESVCFHELIHVIQWAALGVDDFLLTYGVGVLQYGYLQSPLEAVAYRLQVQYEQGIPVPGLPEVVAAKAQTARASTAELFRQHGLTMGA